MGSRSCLVGMEVPVIGSDSIEWFQFSVPSSLSPQSTSDLTSIDTFTKDLGSCSVIGNPPNCKYLFWQRPFPLLECLSCSWEFPLYILRALSTCILNYFTQMGKSQTVLFFSNFRSIVLWSFFFKQNMTHFHFFFKIYYYFLNYKLSIFLALAFKNQWRKLV